MLRAAKIPAKYCVVDLPSAAAGICPAKSSSRPHCVVASLIIGWCGLGLVNVHDVHIDHPHSAAGSLPCPRPNRQGHAGHRWRHYPVLDGRREVRVCLAGIDAPEIDQSYGAGPNRSSPSWCPTRRCASRRMDSTGRGACSAWSMSDASTSTRSRSALIRPGSTAATAATRR